MPLQVNYNDAQTMPRKEPVLSARLTPTRLSKAALRDVIANAVDAFHLIDNLVRNLSHKVVRQMCPVGCHSVCARYGTQSHRMLVSALVAHDSHAAYRREKHRSCLPNLVVQTFAVFTDIVVHSLDIDVVGILKYAHFLACDVAENTNSKTRSGERMTLDEALGHAKLVAYAAHFVLKQPLQRLAELQMHLLRQSANVVMTLDNHTCMLRLSMRSG